MPLCNKAEPKVNIRPLSPACLPSSRNFACAQSPIGTGRGDVAQLGSGVWLSKTIALNVLKPAKVIYQLDRHNSAPPERAETQVCAAPGFRRSGLKPCSPSHH